MQHLPFSIMISSSFQCSYRHIENFTLTLISGCVSCVNGTVHQSCRYCVCESKSVTALVADQDSLQPLPWVSISVNDSLYGSGYSLVESSRNGRWVCTSSQWILGWFCECFKDPIDIFPFRHNIRILNLNTHSKKRWNYIFDNWNV